jgi:integrase
MGTITARKRKDSTVGYTAQIRLKKDGVVVYTEAKTFDRRPAAAAWLTKREKELAEPGTLESAMKEDPALKDAIDRYKRESKRDIGRTKKQVLRAIEDSALGSLKCSEVTSQAIVSFAQGLGVQPQTVGNYVSHLAAVFAVARPAWGYPLDDRQIEDARAVLKKLGQSGRSNKRSRRPTIDEVDRILAYYTDMEARERAAIPMREIIVFALFSTRRQEEICRITWEDYEGDRVLVREMKHPGQKIGNDTWVDLPPEARRVVDAMKRGSGAIFPYNHRSVSGSFTKACKFLTIPDLHFHDLRHEGTSRLFELGLNIPHVAAVTGHRSWSSLQRYAHIRQSGDKWANWKWLEVLAPVTETNDEKTEVEPSVLAH